MTVMDITQPTELSALSIKDLDAVIEKLVKQASNPKQPKVQAQALSQLADELGALRADKADLEAKEKKITGAIKASGLDQIHGALFDATVSRYDMVTLDRAIVESYLTPAQLELCKKTTNCCKVTSSSRNSNKGRK